MKPSPASPSESRPADESRERFDAWYDNGPYGNCDAYIYDRMLAAWQQAERDTQERCARVVETFHKEKCAYYNNSPSKFVMGLCRELADRIRGKGAE